jgi:hypothetical protein
MRWRRVLISVVLLAVLAGTIAVVWHAFDGPPPRLILKYGLPPAGGLTGQTREVGGITFRQVGPGYARIREYGLVWGYVFPLLRLGLRLRTSEARWLEVREAFWISRDEVFADEVTLSADNASIRDRVLDPSAWRAWCGGHLDAALGARMRLPTRAQWCYALYHGALDGAEGESDFTYIRSDDASGVELLFETETRALRRDPGFGIRSFRPGDRIRRGFRLVWIPPDE